MDAAGDWIGKVARDIAAAEGRLGHADQRQLRLSLLLRSARHVASFAPRCPACQALQAEISGLTGDLVAGRRLTGPGRRDYLAGVARVTRHLRRGHRLVEERYYVKRYVLAGIAFGVSTVGLGLALVNFGVTLLTLGVTLPALATRVAFSYTIGRWLDRRARRRGRVL